MHANEWPVIVQFLVCVKTKEGNRYIEVAARGWNDAALEAQKQLNDGEEITAISLLNS